jgi:hypothetical protein
VSESRSGNDRDDGWLHAACVTMISAATGTARHSRTETTAEAEAAGASAADDGLEVADLVAALLRAASATWSDAAAPTPDSSVSTVHRQAADLLAGLDDVADALLRGYQRRLRAEADRFDADRVAFVEDLLTGRADPGRLARRAERYGIRLDGNHTVIVARGHRLTAAVAQRLDAALAARFGDGNVLTARREDDVVSISSGGLRGVASELAHHLVQEVGAGGWQIAVGRSHPGAQGVATSLEEAFNTLDVAQRLGFSTSVLHAADLLVFPVLLRDREAIVDLVTTVLGPLAGARGGAQPYLQTLWALFENQGNHTATARQLHLSVRAVTYRLDRVRSLTGYHPSEPTQRFTLQAAVLGARLLGWPQIQGQDRIT